VGAWDLERKGEKGEKLAKIMTDTLDPISHGKPVLLSCCTSHDDLLCLVKESFVGALLKGYCVIRCIPINPCKWDVVDTSYWVTDSVDFTETAGTEAVVAFHSHDLCDSWHISKDEEKEGMEEKLFLGMEVQACDAPCELFELTIEWIEERIHVFDGFWQGDDSITQQMGKVGLDVGGEAEVYQDDWPCGKIPSVENGEAIEGQTKGNITLVFKVLVIEGLTVHPNKLSAEVTVEFSIEHIGERVGMLAGSVGCTIVQQLDNVFIEEHRFELRANREVLKLHSWFARFIVPGFLTIREWTTVEGFI